MPGLPASRIIASACALCFALPAQAAPTRPPAFTEQGPLRSDAGNFLVKWQAQEPVSLEMQPPDGASVTVYSGHNAAYFLSGLRNGDYAMRLKDATGSTTDTLTLHVQHQSLSRALLLLALGAIAFFATVAVVLRGARDE